MFLKINDKTHVIDIPAVIEDTPLEASWTCAEEGANTCVKLQHVRIGEKTAGRKTLWQAEGSPVLTQFGCDSDIFIHPGPVEQSCEGREESRVSLGPAECLG